MPTTHNLTLAVCVSVALALTAFFATTTPTHAASSDAQFQQLKSQLELLRADITKMRTGSSTRASSTRATVDRSCMQEAVNTREASIKAAFTTYTNSILAAMDTRVTAFSSVWSGTEVSNSSKYRGVWSTWKKAAEDARKKLRSEREAAWKTYRETATKTCKATLPKEETAAQDATSSSI